MGINVRCQGSDHLQQLRDLFDLQRRAFQDDPCPSYETRLDRLNRLLAMTDENEDRFIEVIDADFQGRSAHETRLAELFVVRSGVQGAKRNLRAWMKERKIPTGVQFLPGHNRLMRQPLGIIGVISPWNYPLQLALCPTLSALAAGNRVMIKPSELTPRFNALLSQLINQYFHPDELSIIEGGAEIGAAFSRLHFDHLLFTGSTAVGRIVATAAAQNLTPVTLELGGKSPAIIDASADLATAANRIAYGKWLNAGQTCVAPDYLLVPVGQSQAVADHLAAAVHSLYPTVLNNPDYTAIISDRHRKRLQDMIDEARDSGATIMPLHPENETFTSSSHKIPPTVILHPRAGSRILQEEIFGPVLPILEYATLDEAIAHVNHGDRPLALYWFGQNTYARDRVLHETISGGVTVNDCLWHLAQENQPFGGVGASGMGAYHGEWGFRTFSKEKPVFHQSSLSGSWLLYPPYGRTFDSLLTVLKRIV